MRAIAANDILHDADQCLFADGLRIAVKSTVKICVVILDRTCNGKPGQQLNFVRAPNSPK
jgi:hypothetical protein